MNIRRKIIINVFIATLLGCFIVASGHPYSADGISMIMVSSSIVEGNGFVLEPELGKQYSELNPPLALKGRGGAYYSKYAPLNSLLLVPFVAVGKILSGFAPQGAPPEMPLYFTAGFFNAFTTAATAALLAALCMTAGISGAGAAAAALMFSFATFALHYSRTNFSDPMAAFLTLLCFHSIASYRRSDKTYFPYAIMIAAALLPLGRLSAAIIAFIPLLVFTMASEKRVKILCALIPGLFAGIMIYAGYNFLRFESVFETGYEKGWHLDATFLSALYGFIFSSDKSLFVYSPALLFFFPGARTAVRRGRAEDVIFVSSFLIISITLYAVWSDWGGGHSWGPRFLLPVVPLMMYVAAFYFDRRKIGLQKTLFIGICAISILVQVFSVSAKYTTNYENDFVVEQINDAMLEGRLLAPGAPRFLPMKMQISDSFRNWKYTTGHIREYYGAGGGFDDLLNSNLVERAPDFWAFLVAASSGGKIAFLCLFAFAILAIVFFAQIERIVKILKV